MGGAIAVGLIAFTFARRRTTSFLGGAMHLPGKREIDKPLVIGSLVFGDRLGSCRLLPRSRARRTRSRPRQALVFTLAMLAGMALHDLGSRREPSLRTGK
jgi:hypothetical protein